MPSRSLARLLVLSAVLALFSLPPLAAQVLETPAVVVGAVENLYLRPDETSPVDDQVILGESVTVVETTAGFARVRTRSGNAAWIPERALRRGASAPAGRVARVLSPLAHAYASPDFTEARPLLTAPLGARLELVESVALDGHDWAKVALPDGRVAFVAGADVAIEDADAKRPLASPAAWLALGQRFLEAPYTWGGTTPLGFDCSGLVYRILEQHGVVLMRNSSQMCFRDPQLVPVAFEKLQAGDLLFFGTESRIDHMGMWLGDGRVLQATAYGTPSTQITEFATSPRLKDRFRYARRLGVLPGAPRPGALPEPARNQLERTLSELAARGGAAYGIYFKDLAGGGSIEIQADRVMHAASTMKTPILLELLRRVDAGELKLEQELPVRNEFRSLVDGSPFSIGLEADADGPTGEKLGSSATLEFLASEMIQRSSNLATNVLLSMLGPDAVQRFTDVLGAPTVKVRRCVEDGKAYEKGLNNETDARGMGAVMEACVRTDRLTAASRAKAWEILAGQVWNEQIPKGLHLQSGAVVAHKTGSISSVQHDAAVVRLPDGREYVLVLLANDFGANEAGRRRVYETTRAMSRAVWEAMIAPQ
jgi:beta-lactamase class A